MDHSNSRKPGVYLQEKPTDSVNIARRQEAWSRQLMENEQQRAASEAAGLPALCRLVEVARRDTGQSQICGRFLLAIYNSNAFPFNLSDLRSLERTIWEDCIAVLGLDQRPRKEIHLLIKDGPAIWEELKSTWAPNRRT
ncbi:hypothetical protein D3C84_624050 [compost metagenome]